MNSIGAGGLGVAPRRAWHWILAGWALVACQTSTSPSSAPPPTTPVSSQQHQALSAPVKVSQTLNLAPGSNVDVSGLYFGWKGPCKGQPPTRSAWQLVESNEPFAPCIYVDGPVVKGGSPNAPAANVWLRVQGVLKQEGDVRFIEAVRVDKQ